MSVKVVEQFLRSDKVVCPFAKSPRHLMLEVAREPSRSGRDIRRIAEKYARTRDKKPPRSLILVGPNLEGFAATQAWALSAYVELGTAFGIASGAQSLPARLHAEQLLEWLLDEAAATRPFLSCRFAPVHCMCMAPVYPAGHPRFSRALLVVVNWVAAVKDVPVEQRVAIRATAEARAGGPYDADEYLLPVELPRVPPEPNGARLVNAYQY